ncbi:MAG: hypothetical protein NDJ19_09995 [Ramlibacter sp.]|nr:hypothetical protein [Ramlibacter sp.]
MDTYGSYWVGCLAPLLVFGVLAVACAVVMLRRGCGCTPGMQCRDGQTPHSPRGPAQ